MIYLRQILALLKKELLLMLMDSGTRKILIIPIVVQALVFGYAASFNLNNVPFSILNQANSKLAFDFEQELIANNYFRLVDKCLNTQCLSDSLEQERALIAIYINKDFTDTYSIEVISDAKNTASASSAISYLSEFVNLFNQKHLHTLNTINTRFVFNENIITRHSILSGMILALSMIQVLLLSSLCISRERENKTFDMMLMTPCPTIILLIGKAAAPVFVSLMQSLSLFAICVFYFHIPFIGSFINLFLCILIFSISLVGIGLSISTLTQSTQQSIVFAFILILPCIVLSSLITPIEAIPNWLLPIVYINPLYYGIVCIQAIYLEGKDLLYLFPYILILILYASVTLPMCAYFFRHRLK